MKPIDWAAVRQEFPALTHWTFLNTAAFGQMPRASVAEVLRHFTHRDELACWDFLDWFDDMDHVRQLAAQLIHCDSSDIAFIPNAASALSLLLSGMDWRLGDRVVTLEDEFPNNLYAPGALGATELIETPWERFYDSIDRRTRLVAISTVNYSTGFRPPLEQIAAFLRERGVLLFLDATQSAGALRLDIQQIQPDMLAVHGYKWLLSPNGAGFAYISPALRERLRPNVIGWRSHKDWRNVDNLHHGRPKLPETAERYEGGMLPFALLYAMGESIRMVLELGPERIEERVLDLAGSVRTALRRLGAEVDEYDSPIVAALFPGRDVSAMAHTLKERHVLVSARHGRLRVSPHFYNNERDVDQLTEICARCLG